MVFENNDARLYRIIYIKMSNIIIDWLLLKVSSIAVYDGKLLIVYFIIIIMMSHERHGKSNQRQLDSLLVSLLFIRTSKEEPKVRIADT